MEWMGSAPRDVALLVLSELFGEDRRGPGAVPPRSFPLAEFQEAGARRAARIVQARGGVVIADAVGLGKTYMALALIEEELRGGGTVIVVAPAALRSLWRRPLRRLGRRHGRPLHLLSHSQLSRGSHPPGLVGAASLLVVDEAHRFRNPATRRHAALTELCRGARVVLITATPINNRPADLYVLLRLFLSDDALVGLGVPSLRELFTCATPEADALRRVLREVMVRRSRRMLGSTGAGSTCAVTSGADRAIRFPTRAPPRIARFEDDRIPRLVAGIAALELAPCAVGGDRSGGGGVRALVRLGLLKRLESGTAALATSLTRQLGYFRAFVAALEAGRLLAPRRAASWRADRDADPLQLMLLDLVAGPCPPGLDASALLASARRDADRMRSMRRLLRGRDPKLDALRTLLVSLQPERCVVFTEFRDTAEAIWRGLAPTLRVARIDGDGAWLGLRPASRGAVVQRFAPRSNGAREPPGRERVDVLVATDVLAEGMNLQDARHVVCYDLPWNPVRLMQRVGRVDRLGSPHNDVVPHLFVPAAGLEDLLGLTRRLRAKLGSIATAIADDESLQLLERLGGDGAASLDAFCRLEDRDEDPMERLRVLWDEARGHDGADGRPTGAAPPGERDPATARVARVPMHDESVAALALARYGGRAWLVEIGTDGSVREAGSGAERILHAALRSRDDGTRRRETTSLGHVQPVVRRVAEHFRLLESAGHGPPLLRATDPAARLANRLRAALAGPVATLDHGLVLRAERILRRLCHPLPAPTARLARTLIRDLRDDAAPAAIVDRIEALVGDDRPAAMPATDAPADPTVAPEPALRAILLLGDCGPSAAG